MNPKLEARNIEKIGKSVFAREAIPAGEKLAIFGGHVIPNNSEPQFNGAHAFSLQIDESFSIGALFAHQLEDTDFFNHSCAPNAGIKGQIFLVAMRDIELDEEITFDYAIVLHATQGCPLFEFECNCNSPDCRERVSDDDWKIPELQRKYDGYFSYFIQEKIDQLKRKGDV